MADVKAMEKDEAKEHPKFTKKQVHQIVIDHLKKHIKELGESPEEEAAETPDEEMAEGDETLNPSRNSQKNKFSAMSRVKADIEAEKAGKND